MSIHRSLASQGKLARARSVLTRIERIQKLEKETKWHEGDSIYGLPKVRTKFKTGAKKKKKEAAAAVPGAEGAAATTGAQAAAPAAGAGKSPAAGAKAPAAKPAAKK